MPDQMQEPSLWSLPGKKTSILQPAERIKSQPGPLGAEKDDLDPSFLNNCSVTGVLNNCSVTGVLYLNNCSVTGVYGCFLILEQLLRHGCFRHGCF